MHHPEPLTTWDIVCFVVVFVVGVALWALTRRHWPGNDPPPSDRRAKNRRRGG